MRLSRFGLCAVLLCATACTRERTDLHVVSHSPDGQLKAPAQSIQVVFDKPMVPEAQVGKEIALPPGKPAPLTLEPAVPGKLRWSDRQTLSFLADAPFARSTQYRVSLSPSLRAEDGARTAAPVRFSFTTQRIEVVDLAPADRRFLPLSPTLTLRFSLPVHPKDAAARCLLTSNGKPHLLRPVGASDDAAPTSSVSLTPTAPLLRDTEYNLECDAALQGAEGNVGMAAAYAQTLRTYGDPGVLTAHPTGAQVDADDLNIEIEFKNPMQLGEVREHLSSQPRIAGLREGWLTGPDHRKYRVRVNLEPGTAYEVKVSAGAKDSFGQPLAKDFTYSFTAGDARPRLSMDSGTYTLETASPRYPLWTRNLSSLQIEAARVPEDKIVPLLERYTPTRWDYYDESDENKDQPGDIWRKVGIKPKKGTVPLNEKKNKWRDGALDLAQLSGGGEAPGLYALHVVAEETDRHKSRKAVANVTNLGLLAKLGTTSGLVWAVHLSDGKPAAGVKVSVRDAKNKVRFTGTTGADGLVTVPGTTALVPPKEKGPALREDEPYEGERGAGRLYVLAQQGADLAVLAGDWNDGLQTWNFNLFQGRPSPEGRGGRARGFIQTDRGLYRPGETVHLRGLVRVVRPEGLRPPSEKQVQLTIEDPRGEELLTRAVTLSPYGGFSLDLPLSPEARLGDYDVKATLKGAKGEAATFRDHFSVEEYRPATFELRMNASKKSYQLGETIKVDLAANYLYGAPLSSGKARFSVRRRDHFPSFPAFSEFSFTDWTAMQDEGYYWARYGERSYSYDQEEKEVELDKHGKAALRFSTKDPENKLKTAQDYLIEATVTDPSNQVRTAELSVIAHRSPFYLGVRPVDRMPAVGKPFTVQALAVDEAGKPVAQTAELVATLHEWRCDWGASSSGYSGSYRCEEKNTELERRKVSLSDKGPVDVQLTAKRSGTIYVSLRAPDGHGHEVAASEEVWAYGGAASWRASQDGRFPLMAAKARYRPGETALLMPQASLTGALALVSVERDGILSHKVQPFAPGEAIEIPITERMVPNVYVSVALVRGRTSEQDRDRPAFAMGLVNLEVDATDRRLQIAVTTDQPAYRPGDTVKAKVSVKAPDGTPVQAEVALAAADEGVLQLIGYKTPNPSAAFYAPYPLQVNSATNWNRLLRRNDPSEDSEDGEGGDSGAGAGKVRQKFVSTAYWNPALITGTDGTAEVIFQAPDNLTAFRLMAVGADAGDRFGSGEVRMTVRKPLQAMPALPRFFNIGDKVQAGVVIHNQTGQAGSVKVTAQGQGALSIEGERSKEISVPQGGEKLVLFGIAAPQTGTGKLTFSAALGNESDAVALSLPVQRPVERDVILLGEGEAAPGAPVSLQVTPPQGAVSGEGGLEVVIDPTGMAGIDEGLRYLIDYPYGCLEQTTSRVIPMVKVEDLARSLDLPGLRGEKLRGFVEAGLAKILRHQHDDGAFSLWPGSGTEPFLTAFALYGLTQAQRGGYKVSQKAVDQGISALRQAIQAGAGMGHSDNILGQEGSRAFALYVLAEVGKPDPGAMAKLFERRAALPVFGKAFLARALKRGGGDARMIDALVKDVTDAAKVSGGSARVVEPGGRDLWWFMSSDARTSAIALSMLLEVAPTHPLLPQLAKGLLAQRHGGRWESTQDNLFSLVALADYARGKAKKGATAQVTVSAWDKTLLSAKVGAGVKRVQVPMAQVKAGTLRIAVEGAPVSYGARVRYARSLERVAAESRGFSIDRKMLDPQSGQEKTVLKVGDVVKVVLSVKAGEQRNRVALCDALPAALEPINPRLSGKRQGGSGDDEGGDGEGEDDGEGGSRWTAMELRDDRVAVFADTLLSGREQEFSYLARATSAGTFLLPAATVEEMYRPEHRARTESRVLEVRGR
jgi:hypothetical protein